MRLGLSITGFFISLYLLVVKWLNGNLLVCPTAGCDQVNASSYSMIAGIPVAFFGVIGFLLLINLQAYKQKVELYNMIYTICSFVGVLFTSYLTYLEIVYIKAICFWCASIFVIIIMQFIISLIKWFRVKKEEKVLHMTNK